MRQRNYLQLLNKESLYFAGVEYDFKMNKLDSSRIVELVEFDKEKVHFNLVRVQKFGKNFELVVDPDMAILSSPRIPHPPMDIILAFHFILNNFIDRKKFAFVDAILNDNRYKKILNNSTKRLWEPYFKGFVSDSPHEDYKINKLFPLYIN